MKLRKKPIEIDGIQWTGENVKEVEEFIGDHGYVKGRYVEIGTLEGLMVASPEDWILKGIQGEFYPCKDDIFRMTYELVDD